MDAHGFVLLETMESLWIAVLCPHANVKIQKALYWPDILPPKWSVFLISPSRLAVKLEV